MKKILVVMALFIAMAVPSWANIEEYRYDTKQQEKQTLLNQAYRYLYGEDGVEKDYIQAVYWFRKAAEKGIAEAQFELGVCYHYGEGVAQDFVKATYWYRKAAKQGYSNAQYNLGNRYYKGEGVKQNYSKAVHWWLKSAKQGYSYAQLKVGLFYYQGLGVKQNTKKAKYWLYQAAVQGHPDAINALRQIGE